MIQPLSFRLRQAHEIPPGQAVVRPVDGSVGMKVQQIAKDFVRHYFLPLEPMAAEGLKLVYLDPEDELADCGGPVRLSLGKGRAPGPGERGAAFRNARATFLAARQADREYTMSEAQRFYKSELFIDLTSREVLSRQDRNVAEIFPDWKVDGMAGANGIVPLVEIRAAFAGAR
jgi:hypothetical protein